MTFTWTNKFHLDQSEVGSIPVFSRKSYLPHLPFLLMIFGRDESGTQESGIGKPFKFHHRRPRLRGRSLDFGFRRESMKINKIRPKFHFLTKIEIKMSRLVFLFVVYCFLAFIAIWKPF